MERRVTRAAAAREAALLAASAQPAVPQLSTAPQPSATAKESKVKRQASTSRNVSARKRKLPRGNVAATYKRKKMITVIPPDIGALPHNLGSVLISQNQGASGASNVVKEPIVTDPLLKEEELDKLKDELQETVDKATETLHRTSDTKAKKKKKGHPYGLTPGVSPFPDWQRPTPEECEEVNRLLASVHGEANPPATVPQPSLTVTGCGEVPSVLDALIRTLLSGATTGANSAMAFQGLVSRFGILQEGIGKGSVNWDAVRRAPIKDVYEAMKSGGLADVKSRYLKQILDMVHRENMERRTALLRAKQEGRTADLPGARNETEVEKGLEIERADENVLSLNHIHSLTTEEAMLQLTKYPGIGPKTAACVILFCLQRPCFAVDTHIFRICKWLGWVPPDRKVTEITAFGHLDARIPDHLKYSLHQLFIRHGKTCPRCRAITGETSEGWEEGCVIDHLVKRTGKRKGGGEPPSTVRKSA
ncbi:hypothetical protein VTN02DRAFT_5051 [Thermoascus thermophilus]